VSEPVLIERQRAVFRELARLAAEKTSAQAALETKAKATKEAVAKEWAEARQKIAARWEAEKAATEKEYETSKQAFANRFAAEHTAAKKAYTETRDKSARRFEEETEKATRKYQEFRWTTQTVFEASEKSAKGPFEKVQQHIAAALLKVQGYRDESQRLVRQWRHSSLLRTSLTAKPNRHHEEPQRNLQACLKDAEEMLADLKALVVPRLVTPLNLLVCFLMLWLVLSAALWTLFPDGWVAGKYHWLAVSSGATVLLAVAAAALLYVMARFALLRIYKPLATALGDAEITCQRWTHLATKQYDDKLAELAEAQKRRDADLRKAEEKHRQTLAALQAQQAIELRQAQEKYPPLLTKLEQQRDQGLRQAEEKYRRTMAAGPQRFTTDTKQAEEKYTRQCSDLERETAGARKALAVRCAQALARIQTAGAEIATASGRLFPAWSQPSWNEWQPPQKTPPAIRFGEYRAPLEAVTGAPIVGPPSSLTSDLNFPALLAFPQRCSMLFRTRDAGRQVAVQSLQAVMFRFLTSLPPGKVRFTIIDPVGLGENFSAFMHLADYDEALVNSRIWTEPAHIEQRLADIAAHMENVIQKYLRNQYKSIEEYNAQAGEVAEPFRVLVVANFPVNFTPEAARRLVSIASSGASCGVFTLISVDTRQPMPDGFNLADLEPPSVTLSWKEPRFVWKDADFGPHPLTLDPPPEPALLNRILHQVGDKAREANRVEVPFDFIAPKPEEWWTRDSRGGIEVPLGRAGATKRQYLQLGQGTAQHALIAGKTGSGKSTLLHVLITNLGLLYSPDEVELYLVDFKKGVEFKTYAAQQLPHARVIAIESEREFGLSVLQRLDLELKQRGERFRQAGVNHISDYREATNGAPCPRILLIVDEFQEFFVEDDKVAQEAALLLDRLVRQGRAFGLHILLGSQTLGGAYSLARSTIDQMAVRIALQCSEADAHLILSKDNSAARLLSRPGEAIYNDANGLLEGNDIFQIVWLADDRREALLQSIHERAQKRKAVLARPQIVFEGNAPADLSNNRALQELLAAPTWPAAPRALSAWLGEAVAIKDPTAAMFRRQTSSNLLLIGQHEEAALGVLAAATLSLAAQAAPSADPNLPAAGARFCIIDGTPADAPHAGVWGKLASLLPHATQLAAWRDVPGILAEVATEVERRQKANETEAPPIFVFIHGLQRFKELRRGDDDFGYSRHQGDAPAPPPQLLQTILREGPAVGVHGLVWCDTLTNLQRAFDRQGMRDFEMRVLFQMSANDSSFLIDSPAASKLGVHRALFCSEDQGLVEKFRPYRLPAEQALAEGKRQLSSKRYSQQSAANV
jgi:hypothetical protein